MAPLRQYREWQPGDEPQSHPLWQEQVDLEIEMTTRGADRYWSRVDDAMDPGASLRRQEQRPGSLPPEMSRVPAFRRKMEQVVPLVAEALRRWIQQGLKDRRKADGAHPVLQAIEPEVAALIAIRTIMDRVGVSNMRLLSVAMQIGHEVELQARMQAWVGHEKDLRPEDRLFGGIKSNLKQQGSTARHIRRVNINRFNKLISEEVQWQDWDHDTRRRVGLRMVDMVVKALPDFTVIANPEWHAPETAKKRKEDFKPANIIAVSDELVAGLEDRMNREALSCPIYMPTLMPPKRWNGVRGGGYYAPCTRRPALIGFHNLEESERRNVLEDFNAFHMPKVYAAINCIQETPWRINEKVHAVAQRIWDEDLAIAGLVRQEAKLEPPKPAGWDRQDIQDPKARHDAEAAWASVHHEHVREWKIAASEVHRENAQRISKSVACRETLHMAARLHRREFYFPHRLDFCGRMYPIPAHLQPQGNDLAKGLLTFAHGREIGIEGAHWLAVHVANCFGHDKLTFEQRAAWTRDNEVMLTSIAEAPLRDRRWITETDSKSQWQALAATFEWVRYLKTGPSMVSALPIRVDGTCNGIQHLAAMMKDETTGEKVNLIPGDQRRDIYMDVAAILQKRLEVIAEGGGKEGLMAGQWLHSFGGSVPRSFTKQPVMTKPYGATRHGVSQHVWAWLKENESGAISLDDGERGTAVQWILNHLLDAVQTALPSPGTCMDWIRRCAQRLSEAQQTIVWQTPSGFVVRHAYRVTERKQVETQIDGRRLQVRVEQRTKKLDVRRQLQSIAPNFTHSMDASANVEALAVVSASPDPMPITTIHDAYGTVPARVGELGVILRRAFVEVHSRDVLAEFRNACVSLFRDHLLATKRLDWAAASAEAERLIPALPPRGTLDVRQVMGSRYFFS